MAIFKGILFVLFIAVTAADMNMKMDMSQVKISSEAGSMEFRRQMGNTSEMSDPVKIKMAEVVQIGADGQEITDCAKNGNPLFSMFNPMKRFSDFAGKTFNIDSTREQAAMPNAGSLKASMTKFSADLGTDVGNLAIDLAIAEEGGEVAIGGEKLALEKGDMKFNIELTEWKWCGEEDADGAAKFLDVYMEVRGKLTPTVKQARSAAVPASFDIGDNMTVSFSGKFQKDSGVWADMVEGYPKVDPSNPYRVIVRFPRFSSKLVYDPAVTGAAAVTSLSTILVTMTTVVVSVMLNGIM